MKVFLKFLQRRLYSFLNSKWGFSLTLILVYCLLRPILDSYTNSCSLRGGSSLFCSKINFSDNIVSEDLESHLAYGPIDVVYTWVNGSDPIWLEKKDLWTSKYERMNKLPSQTIVSNSTVLPQYNSSLHGYLDPLSSIFSNNTEFNSTNSGGSHGAPSEETPAKKDDTNGANRYRNSNELKYSLRSLVKNAPWVHHIYIVTDNQIPSWLNLETNRLTVISHEQIFANKSHLPVFSSPAIEAHLHKIPNLSKKFIYFNDDVFLGAPVSPEDFVSLQGVQKLTMSWDVPKCAPGCSDSWIGDGYCDKACNVESCNFDFPDCVNGTNSGSSSSYNGQHGNKDLKPIVHCMKGCPDNWLADKICDQRCRSADCAWDVGDCGIDLVTDEFPGAALSLTNTVVTINNEDLESYTPYVFELFERDTQSLKGGGQRQNNEHTAIPGWYTSPSYLSHYNYTEMLVHINATRNAVVPAGLADSASSELAVADSGDGFNATRGSNSGFLNSTYALSNSTDSNNTDYSGSDSNDVVTPDMHSSFSRYHTPTDDGYHHEYPYGRGDTVWDDIRGGYIDPSEETLRQKLPSNVVLSAPIGTKAVHIDLSLLPCLFLRLNATGSGGDNCNPLHPTHRGIPGDGKSIQTFSGFEFTMAEHSDMYNYIVQTATLLRLHHKLVLILMAEQEDKPDPPILPYNVSITVTGTQTHKHTRPIIVDAPTLVNNSSSGNNSSTTNSTASNSAAENEIDHLIFGSSANTTPPTEETVTSKDTVSVTFILQITEVVENQLEFTRFIPNDMVLLNDSHAAVVASPTVSLPNSRAGIVRAVHSQPERSSTTESGNSTNTSDRPKQTLKLIDAKVLSIPYSGCDSTTYACNNTQEGAVLQLNTQLFPATTDSGASSYDELELGQVQVKYTLTLRNGRQYTQTQPLSQTLLFLQDDEQYRFATLADRSDTNSSVVSLLQSATVGAALAESRITHGLFSKLEQANTPINYKTNSPKQPSQGTSIDSTNTRLFVLLPMPVRHSEMRQTYVHFKVELLLRDDDDDTDSADSHETTTIAASNEWSISDSNSDTAVATGTSNKQSSRLGAVVGVVLWGTAAGGVVDLAADVVVSPTTAVGITSVETFGFANQTAVILTNTTLVDGDVSTATDALSTIGVNTTESHRTFDSTQFTTKTAVSEESTQSGAQSVSVSEDSVEMDHRRRLQQDTYAQSLIHVNRLYNRDFGIESRKVPAHLPHMIDREVMIEMQNKYSKEWQETSRHRFRSVKDMQYSFSYYYYLIHRHKASPPNYKSFVSKFVDTNFDTYVDHNEMHTLVAILKGGSPSRADIANLYECVANSSTYGEIVGMKSVHSEPTASVTNASTMSLGGQNMSDTMSEGLHQVELNTTSSLNSLGPILDRLHRLYQSASYRHPTVDEVYNCSLVTAGLKDKLEWDKRAPTHELLSDKDTVAFEMIGDNTTDTLRQLDSVRARQSKFVCINDNMQNPSAELIQGLQDFYLSFFPIRSIFELPDGESNPTLYLTEYMAMKRSYFSVVLDLLRNNVVTESIVGLVSDCWYASGMMSTRLSAALFSVLGFEQSNPGPLLVHQSANSHNVYRDRRELSGMTSLVLFISILVLCIFIAMRTCIRFSRRRGSGGGGNGSSNGNTSARTGGGGGTSRGHPDSDDEGDDFVVGLGGYSDHRQEQRETAIGSSSGVGGRAGAAVNRRAVRESFSSYNEEQDDLEGFNPRDALSRSSFSGMPSHNDEDDDKDDDNSDDDNDNEDRYKHRESFSQLNVHLIDKMLTSSNSSSGIQSLTRDEQVLQRSLSSDSATYRSFSYQFTYVNNTMTDAQLAQVPTNCRQYDTQLDRHHHSAERSISAELMRPASTKIKFFSGGGSKKPQPDMHQRPISYTSTDVSSGQTLRSALKKRDISPREKHTVQFSTIVLVGTAVNMNRTMSAPVVAAKEWNIWKKPAYRGQRVVELVSAGLNLLKGVLSSEEGVNNLV